MKHSLPLALCCAFFIAASSASAQVSLWTDGTDDWFNSGAWSSGVPASNTLAQVNNGGTAQVLYGNTPAVAGGIWLGANAGNIGNLTVTKQLGPLVIPGVLNVTNTLQVGLFGQGSLIVSRGARVSAGNTIVAREPGSRGTVTVTGAGSLLSSSTAFELRSGIGTLLISAGGRLSAAQVFVVGQGGTATATVTGAGSIVSASDYISVAAFGSAKGVSAVLRMEAGAEASAPEMLIGTEGILEVAPDALVAAQLTVSGGGRIRALGDIIFPSNVQSVDEPGGAFASGVTLDSNGFNAIFTGVFTGTHGLTKTGNETATLTSPNSYSGGTAVTAGTLLVNNTQGSGTGADTVQVRRTSGATLGGTGRIGSGVNVEGTLAPGDANPGTLEVDGSINLFSIAAPSVAMLAIRLGGSTPGDGAGFYSQLQATNPAAAINLQPETVLNVSLHGGFQPAATDVFYIVTREDSGAFGTPFADLPEGATVLLGGGFAGIITYEANWTGSQETSTLSGGNDIAIYSIVSFGAAMPANLGISTLPDESIQLDWQYLADNASSITFFVERSLDLQGDWGLIGKFAGSAPGAYSFVAPNPRSPEAFYRVSASTAGCALRSDGTPRYVTVPHQPALNSYPLTISAWIKTSRNATQVDGIVSKYIDASSNGYSMLLYGGHVYAWYVRSGVNQVFRPSLGLDGGFVADDQWHHLAFSIDASGGKLYVDGMLRESLAWSGTPGATTTTTAFQIGRYHNYPTGFLGEIDEVSVWSVGLTPAQVVALYHRGPAGTEAGLEARWTLDDGVGTVATDRTANARHGTLINSPEWVRSTAPIFR